MIEPQDIEILRELAERLPTKMERAFNRLLDAVQRATR